MILINFSHPFTTSQMEALGTLLGGEVGRVVDVKTHFDQQASFEPQVAGLVDGVGLSSHDWQTLPKYACSLLRVLYCDGMPEWAGRFR